MRKRWKGERLLWVIVFTEISAVFYERGAKLIQSLPMISADYKNIFVSQENSAEG